MEIIIEELDRGNKPITRHKFAQSTVKIGRGYSNDVIVTDPHVCNSHLRIYFDDDNWHVHDEGSVNGSYLANEKPSARRKQKEQQNAHQHTIVSGDIIRFGKSRIRVLLPDHPIAESIAFSPLEKVIDLTQHPLILFANIALFTVVAGGLDYLNKVHEVHLTQLIVPAVSVALLFAVWPAVFAILSHLTKQDSHLVRQIGISFMFFNLLWISDMVERMVAFNFSSHWPLPSIAAILPLSLIFSLCWFNCHIAFQMSKHQHLLAAAGITLVLFATTLFTQLSNDPTFSNKPNYSATIMAPAFLLASGSSVDDFISTSEQLFVQAQQQITKPIND